MKRANFAAIPFIVMLVFIPVYRILDSLIFVKVFGCGCVPSSQTNMLNIAFNANDLQRVVFTVLTIILTCLGIYIAKAFKNWGGKIVYCVAILVENALLSSWVIHTFIWK